MINPNIPKGIHDHGFSYHKALLWPGLVLDYQTTGHHPMECGYT